MKRFLALTLLFLLIFFRVSVSLADGEIDLDYMVNGEFGVEFID
ncbi:MAG TPA: hypothetical protein PLZ08_09280 [Bacillota bacterium]|jgi:hypothetical protein|nr:hypothetical protein [Bacillota bacterium]HOL10378.1 hypothetical protein [Bacillota bacterium]HPO98129.1 hypothetical protein [Bacillota bacterium]